MKSGSISRTFCKLKAFMFNTLSRSTLPLTVSTIFAAPLILCTYQPERSLQSLHCIVVPCLHHCSTIEARDLNINMTFERKHEFCSIRISCSQATKGTKFQEPCYTNKATDCQNCGAMDKSSSIRLALILCSNVALSPSVTRSILLITTTSANASCSTDCVANSKIQHNA